MVIYERQRKDVFSRADVKEARRAGSTASLLNRKAPAGRAFAGTHLRTLTAGGEHPEAQIARQETRSLQLLIYKHSWKTATKNAAMHHEKTLSGTGRATGGQAGGERAS